MELNNKRKNLKLVLKTFKATFYSSSQPTIFVNDEKRVALKVFKRVKYLWVLKFYKNNAFSAITSNFEKFQPIGVLTITTVFSATLEMIPLLSWTELHAISKCSF